MSGFKFPTPPPTCSGHLYEVKPGDTLYLIGKKFGKCVQQMIEANPQLANPDLIYPGQMICVPGVHHHEYCLVLKPKPICDSRYSGGVAWIKMFEKQTRLIVVGCDLPDPHVFREKRYRARCTWENDSYELPMMPVMEDPVWLGFGFLPFIFPPAFFLGGGISIFPGPVLWGFF